MEKFYVKAGISCGIWKQVESFEIRVKLDEGINSILGMIVQRLHIVAVVCKPFQAVYGVQ